jgi:hypothetical protein
MLFLVKVRVDLKKLPEFGTTLQRDELDNSAICFTHCLKDDPAVGLAVWEVADKQEFKTKFDPWRPYYSEIEVSEVVTPAEAQQLLLQSLGSESPSNEEETENPAGGAGQSDL